MNEPPQEAARSAPSVQQSGRYVIVVGEFYPAITGKLVEGAEAALARHGVGPGQIRRVSVPGAFEIPMACRKLAASGEYAAVIALGAVIRGETAHFDYVAGECARGIAQLNLQGDIPVIFGVLTTDTADQAEERADPAAGDKGGAAAEAALEMVSLLRTL